MSQTTALAKKCQSCSCCWRRRIMPWTDHNSYTRWALRQQGFFYFCDACLKKVCTHLNWLCSIMLCRFLESISIFAVEWERVVHVQHEMSFPKAVLLVCWVPFDSGTLTETWTSWVFQVAKAKSISTEVTGCTHSASILKSQSIYCDRMHSI